MIERLSASQTGRSDPDLNVSKVASNSHTGVPALGQQQTPSAAECVPDGGHSIWQARTTKSLIYPLAVRQESCLMRGFARAELTQSEGWTQAQQFLNLDSGLVHTSDIAQGACKKQASERAPRVACDCLREHFDGLVVPPKVQQGHAFEHLPQRQLRITRTERVRVFLRTPHAGTQLAFLWA